MVGIDGISVRMERSGAPVVKVRVTNDMVRIPIRSSVHLDPAQGSVVRMGNVYRNTTNVGVVR